MTLSDRERDAAKVEELDRMIAELQKRRESLLRAMGTGSPEPPTTKAASPETKAPPKPDASPRPLKRTIGADSKTELERTLDALPWKGFKKREGEWAFLRDRQGRLVDELQSQKDFVDKARKEGSVVVGKYRYQVSEDKFLNRYYSGA
jgi:hypothetical protein